MSSAVGRRRFLGLVGAGAATVAFSACSGSASPAKRAGTTTPTTRPVTPYFPPTGGWATGEATAVGWDPVALQAALDFAGQRATSAMVVVVGGKVVAQQSWGTDLGFARDIASAQKSVVALLVGNLVDAGRMQLDEPVAAHLGGGWSKATVAQEEAISVRHLLTMTSGLADDLTYETTPGTLWRYNTNAYQQLPRVVEVVAGDTIEAVSRAALFDPIGVSATSRWQDRPGPGPLSVDPNGRRIQGLVMTAPDMARVGLLVARRGDWNGRAVLTDRRYLAAALDSSQELNPSYGYLWWLNGQDAHVLPGPPLRTPGPLIPDAPEDLVAALGKDDQKIYVCRSLDVVVTRIGGSAGPRRLDALSGFDTELWRRLVLAAPG